MEVSQNFVALSEYMKFTSPSKDNITIKADFFLFSMESQKFLIWLKNWTILLRYLKILFYFAFKILSVSSGKVNFRPCEFFMNHRKSQDKLWSSRSTRILAKYQTCHMTYMLDISIIRKPSSRSGHVIDWPK